MISFLLVILASVHAFSENLEIQVVKSQNQTVSYSFGRTFLGSANYVRFDITNSGSETIPFERAYMYGSDFTARHSCQYGIPAKGRCRVEFRYWPYFEGFHNGQFEMNFDGNNDFLIYLHGEARR